MALAIGHFALGAMVATVVVGVLAPRTRFKGTIVVASGFWGMIPDVYLASPNYLGWLEAVHDSSQANLFWFHRALDVADPADTAAFSARLVALWLGVTVLVEFGGFVVALLLNWTRSRNRDQGRDRTDHGLGPGD